MCKDNIALANLDYAKHYNAKRRVETDFKKGDQVLLSMANITTNRPMKKLDVKYSGPFTILDKIGKGAYRLDLPPSMKCHNVFNITLLRPFEPTVEGQSYNPPPPVEVDDIGESWEVKSIIKSKRLGKQLWYLVEWEGFNGTPQELSWEPAANLDNCEDAIDEFNKRVQTGKVRKVKS